TEADRQGDDKRRYRERQSAERRPQRDFRASRLRGDVDVMCVQTWGGRPRGGGQRLESEREIARRLKAALRSFLETAEDQALDGGRDRGPAGRRRRRLRGRA